MNIEIGLRQYILANPGVVALIGDKFDPHEAAQDQKEPFVVYKLDGADEPRFLDGRTRFQKFLYELECCDVSYDAAVSLADTVKAAVGGGTASVSTTLDGTAVIMFWHDPPIRKTHISAQDRTRHQVSLYLRILIK